MRSQEIGSALLFILILYFKFHGFGRIAGVRSILAHLVLKMLVLATFHSTWFGSVMEIINNITMLSVILPGAAQICEREHGTLETSACPAIDAGGDHSLKSLGLPFTRK
jgi:hypothetical protein